MTKEKTENLAFDLDGVVFDSASEAHKIMMAELGIDFMERVDRFDTCLLLPDTMSKEEKIKYVVDMWTRAVPLAKPYAKAEEALRAYYDHIGKPLHFLTARWPSLEEATKDALADMLSGVPWDITFRDCGDKCGFLKSQGFTGIVEDRFRTANEVASDLGRAYLVNRPWNRGRKEAGGVVRIPDLFALVPAIPERDVA